MLGVVSFLAVLTLVTLLSYFYLFKFAFKNLPPGPTPLPLLGNLLVLGEPFHQCLKNLADKYGKVFRLYIGETLVVVLSGDAIREALVRKPSDFAGRPSLNFYKIALRDETPLVLVDYGDHWRTHRRLAHKSIKVYGTNRYEKVIKLEVNELCQRMSEAEGKPIGIRLEIGLSVMNVICSKIFGSRYDIEDAEFLEMFHLQGELFRLSVVAGRGLVDLFPFLRFVLPISGDVKLMQSTNDQWRAILLGKFHEHQQTFDQDNLRDYTDVMLNTRREAVEENSKDLEFLEDKHLVSSITTLFIAGSETAATTLSWAVLYLLHFPDIQERLHAEIDQVIGKDEVLLDMRRKLPLLEAFICETMRYSTILPLSVPHKTTKNTTIKGYDLPKGTTVLVNIWALHRDPSIWKDPTVFNPDRFLDVQGRFVFPHGDCFLPFGAGPRACMGEVLARCELFLFLANLLQKFTFENPPGIVLPSLEPLAGGAVLQPRIEQVCVKKRL